MRKIKAALLIVYCFFSTGLFSEENQKHLNEKVIIIGGGIIGAMESYNLYLNAVKNNRQLNIVVYEKGKGFEDRAQTNTAYHICPSLTPDEILSVVPRGSELVEKLALLFSQPGGIRVDDVSGANNSVAALEFMDAVEAYGNDPNHQDRTQHLLTLGKISMELWQDLYDKADSELKDILDRSNFNPCREPKNKERFALHDGYRIDLIYEVCDAHHRAHTMEKTYKELGYTESRLLSPNEVIKIDPSLTCFAIEHSEIDALGQRVWKNDTAAIWRPGGCLSTCDFLPALYAYLKKVMGTYLDPSFQIQECFTLEFNKEVVEAVVDKDAHIVGLKFQDGSIEYNDPSKCSYVFCPGESVGTLKKLGFDEPSYAGFAGPSLSVCIPLASDQVLFYKDFNHCMEVHKVGIVLAWQARLKDNSLLLKVGGTKAFYGDKEPQINEAFALHQHLVQLNMLNDVLPQMISIACGQNTAGKQLAFKDLRTLEKKGMLHRWVGRRAVAYDGFPTLGALFYDGSKVKNGRCTTHLGSGGVSFAPAAVQISQNYDRSNDPFTKKILEYADSRR